MNDGMRALRTYRRGRESRVAEEEYMLKTILSERGD